LRKSEHFYKTSPNTGPFELLCGYPLIDGKGSGKYTEIVRYYKSH